MLTDERTKHDGMDESPLGDARVCDGMQLSGPCFRSDCTSTPEPCRSIPFTGKDRTPHGLASLNLELPNVDRWEAAADAIAGF